MTEQEIRESNFLVYRWDINPELPEAEQLPECSRCEGWGKTDEDKARNRHFGRCEPCFGTGYAYPGDEIVAHNLRHITIHECLSCPSGDCGLSQHTNGLIAWCEAGHIYELDKADVRYSQT